MKKPTKHPKLDPVDRWTAAARGAVGTRRLGKPRGELNRLIHMSAEWSKIPNTLAEDADGKLWLVFTGRSKPDEIDADGGYELVTVEEALEWLQTVSEFTDGHDGDVADVCRIALAELARRPCCAESVRQAIADDVKAGFKQGGIGKAKRR